MDDTQVVIEMVTIPADELFDTEPLGGKPHTQCMLCDAWQRDLDQPRKEWMLSHLTTEHRAGSVETKKSSP